nr:WRKY34 [Phoebe bournei]
MCSLFWQGMENNQGDLADIVRAGGGGGGGSMSNPTIDWQFPSEPTNLPLGIEEPFDDFGDPFLDMPDPLLHELDLAGSVFFNGSNSTATTGLVKMNIGEDDSGGVGCGNFVAQNIVGDEMKRPCNIFSRMLQISPTSAKMTISPRSNSPLVAASQRGIKPPLDTNDLIKPNSTVQISTPRNPGIKRRKSQAKQVVCIPAPAAANNRPSGEVVPSDLWAWRKYGQKPIKGSPYPRGYYRCSSSKGCSARKQVERSRHDPNMLVITYTSEHNHPWPTQRNALAGSTRSQPLKNNAASKNSPSTHTPKPTTFKEEHKENDADNSSSAITVGGSTTSGGTVKEEMEKEKLMDIADHEYDEQDFNQSYRSLLLDSSHSDDFFADLGELGPDPLNLISSEGFSAEKSDEERVDKALDPFNLFDWSGN